MTRHVKEPQAFLFNSIVAQARAAQQQQQQKQQQQQQQQHGGAGAGSAEYGSSWSAGGFASFQPSSAWSADADSGERYGLYSGLQSEGGWREDDTGELAGQDRGLGSGAAAGDAGDAAESESAADGAEAEAGDQDQDQERDRDADQEHAAESHGGQQQQLPEAFVESFSAGELAAA
jgi:far upstream element-binding protein